MNLAKILKDRRDAERRLELTSPKPVFNGGAADSVEGGGNEIISDGVTLAQLTTGLAGKSNTDHAHDDRYYTQAEVDALIGSANTFELLTNGDLTNTELLFANGDLIWVEVN